MADSAEEVLRAISLSVSRRNDTLFHDITLVLRKSKPVVITGKSGSGKSTLLRALVGFEPLDQGEIHLMGRPAGQWGPREFRRRVSLVMQQSPMFEGTVSTNVSYGPKLRGLSVEPAEVSALLERVSLGADMADRHALELSGGERQRVALARALANEPDALLLDEPTSALDPDTSRDIMRSIRQLANEGLAVLVVSHDPSTASMLQAERFELGAWGLREGQST